MSESELIEKIQSGDMNAFGELFEIYKNESLKYSYLITGNKFTSEDIVQEAFIKCFSSIKNLRNVENFKSWFFKILTRTAWKYSRIDKKVMPVEDIFEKADDESIEKSMNDYIRNEEGQMLHTEIERLDIKQRTVIVLFYFNNLSVKEIAKIMGCFEGTVKSRLSSARKKLKVQLSKDKEVKSINVKECGV